jgi:hypothetical protein
VFNVIVKVNETVDLRCVCHDNFKLFAYKQKLGSEIHLDRGEVLSVESADRVRLFNVSRRKSTIFMVLQDKCTRLITCPVT